MNSSSTVNMFCHPMRRWVAVISVTATAHARLRRADRRHLSYSFWFTTAFFVQENNSTTADRNFLLSLNVCNWNFKLIVEFLESFITDIILRFVNCILLLETMVKFFNFYRTFGSWILTMHENSTGFDNFSCVIPDLMNSQFWFSNDRRHYHGEKII